MEKRSEADLLSAHTSKHPQSSNRNTLPYPQRNFGHIIQIPTPFDSLRVRNMFSRIDDMNLHLGMEFEAIQELWGDKEILACTLLAGNVYHALMHHSFIAWIHTLIDLVDNAERRLGEILESHKVENGRDGALATGLAVRIENTEGLVFTVGMC